MLRVLLPVDVLGESKERAITNWLLKGVRKAYVHVLVLVLLDLVESLEHAVDLVLIQSSLSRLDGMEHELSVESLLLLESETR